MTREDGQVSEPLYGLQTELALANFDFGGALLGRLPLLVEGLGAIKAAAANANASLGLIDWAVAQAIVQAASELRSGRLNDHLVVDELEASGGTSTNMNVNEVLAHRAAELLGKPRGAVHANDVVNLGQSTNDVFPAAIKIASRAALTEAAKSLEDLGAAIAAQAEANRLTYKLGRTCLQDAQPMTYGQSFGAWNALCGRQAALFRDLLDPLLELPLGATAIGTGFGAGPGFREALFQHLAMDTGQPWRASPDTFDALSNADLFARISAAVRTAGLSLGKIGNDLQILSSGPVGGFGEIRLPERQAGSSIMPGKVNPVMPMAMCQLGFVLTGYDVIVAQACQQGQLEINPYEPVISTFLLRGFDLLIRSTKAFREFCIEGLIVDQERAFANLSRSSAIATAFVPELGYDKVAAMVEAARAEKRDFTDVIGAKLGLSRAEIAARLAESVGRNG